MYCTCVICRDTTYMHACLIVYIRTYPDKAVMEMEADEAGCDAGVVGESSRDDLTHERLGVGAGGVVEPHLELGAAPRRQQQAHGGDARHQAGKAAAASAHPLSRHCQYLGLLC